MIRAEEDQDARLIGLQGEMPNQEHGSGDQEKKSEWDQPREIFKARHVDEAPDENGTPTTKTAKFTASMNQPLNARRGTSGLLLLLEGIG